MQPPARPTSLATLIAESEGARLVAGSPDTCVTGVSYDSRQVQPGDLFVAVPGQVHDGLKFVPEAAGRGAAAVAAERPIDEPLSLPLVLVDNARRALADFAAAAYGHPSKQQPVVGITGTDGKTTTTHLLSAILEAHGLRTGWLTTVNTRIGDELRANTVDHTTPEAPVVQRTLAEFVAAKLDVGLLETSSHALALERVRGTHFKVGVFTNLSPEHINFHGSFDAYRAAKRKLFEALPADGLAVLNSDDPSWTVMHDATRARVLTFGINAAADISAHEIRVSPSGLTFTLEPGGIVVQSRLVGRFNVSNWLAAYAAATYFGATVDDLLAAARTQAPVPGRMNLVDQGQAFAVVVDFAHTPQALQHALASVRALASSGRVLLAFGLAGGRDFANRPAMGRLAAEQADFFAITQDDPGDEDAQDIAEAIADGARSVGRDNFVVELDRRAAIRLLLQRAGPGDAVLLAGKGHEQRMVVGRQRLPWNDAQVASEVLRDLGFEAQAVP